MNRSLNLAALLTLTQGMKSTASQFLATQLSQVEVQGFPTVDVKVDGQSKTLYIAHPFWWTATGGGNEIKIPHNGRAYLSESPSVNPESYFSPVLLGGSMSYDIDMSQAGCGCVAALYTTLMPGKD